MRLLVLAQLTSHPPLRFIIGMWAIATGALAVAFWQRSVIEQWNAIGFALASLALIAAWPRREMILAFVGFGVGAAAAFVRVVSAIAVASTGSGAQIIVVAWTLIFFKATQRTASSYLAIMARQNDGA